MRIQGNPLFRRLRKHAQKRLVFDPGVSRHQQLPAYKRYIQLESEMLKRYHRKGDSGLKVCQARAAMIDVLIENLFLAALDLYVQEHGKLPCKMAVIATGGYGRAELNPHSDIDIMFLYPERGFGKGFDKFQEVLAEEILYPLWDLGLKVGHASRNTKQVLEECHKEIHSRNAIMESRFICGSEPLFEKMYQRFSDYCRKDNPTAYIRQRLADEKARHAKAGNTVFLQEPDIKNGVGGLRDYQNILWMAYIKYGYSTLKELEKAKLLRPDERADMEEAYDFLLRTRTELHLLNRRPTDKLDLEQQTVVAENLKFTQRSVFKRVEAFMQRYYSSARTIYHTSEILKERLALESRQRSGRSAPISFREALRAHQRLPMKRVDGFLIYDKVLSADSKDVFKKDPLRMIRVFRLMQQFGASLDPDLKYLITRSIPLIDHHVINNESAAKSFNAILRMPGEVHPVLRLMHELGVLGRYLPEFGELTCMVQHEYYHRYTADEHVLRTIKHLDDVFLKTEEEEARYEKELRKNDDPLLLYLILLLHDIGKSEGIQGHAMSGAHLAKPVLDRFGIGAEQQEQILFIIRNHLEMARFWQRFDLDDPQTAASFAQLTEDPQKLRFLYVHTYCDARGTAPTLWNSYKDSMHRTLYVRALEQFEDDSIIEAKRKEQKTMLHHQILERAIQGVSREEVDAHFRLLPERYFINTSRHEIELHLRMVNTLLTQIQNAESMGALEPVVDWRDDIDLGMTVINVVTWDRAGLFYKLAGALTLAGVTIASTKAISRTDHITIDTFHVIDPEGGVVSNPKAQTIFKERLHEALIQGKDHSTAVAEFEGRYKSKLDRKDMLPAPFPPSVDVYHELSLKRTIIEVQANDRIGLLYHLARLITQKGFDISFARVATERGVAMDTFYIENVNSKESTRTSNLLELREELDAVVRDEIPPNQ
ncbi:MAG: [protein-PII] uridylyltransferase [Verrucomicrobiota bacterium]